MDDFRRRYDVPRRDYGMPAGPKSSEASPAPAPPAHQPQHPQHHTQHPPQAPAHQPHHQPATIEDLRPPTQRYTPPPAHHQPAATPRVSPLRQLTGQKAFKLATGVIILLVAGLLAFIFLKPAKKVVVLPADLAKQASFSFYYPSSDTSGFNYDQTKSTVSNGQAYFLLNKGTEHIVVREQNWSSSILDSSAITNPAKVQTLIGQAAIGTNSGQTAAAVLAGHTLINITSNGSVPQPELIAIINSLKNISPNQ
jgi:hypothetical protein